MDNNNNISASSSSSSVQSNSAVVYGSQRGVSQQKSCNGPGCSNKFSMFQKSYECSWCKNRFCSNCCVKYRFCGDCSLQMQQTLDAAPMIKQEYDMLKAKMVDEEHMHVDPPTTTTTTTTTTTEIADLTARLQKERERRIGAEQKLLDMMMEQDDRPVSNNNDNNNNLEQQRIEELERKLLSMKVELESARRSVAETSIFSTASSLVSNNNNNNINNNDNVEELQRLRSEVSTLRKMTEKYPEMEAELFELRKKCNLMGDSKEYTNLANQMIQQLRDAEDIIAMERNRSSVAERQVQELKAQCNSSVALLNMEMTELKQLETTIDDMKTMITTQDLVKAKQSEEYYRRLYEQERHAKEMLRQQCTDLENVIQRTTTITTTTPPQQSQQEHLKAITDQSDQLISLLEHFPLDCTELTQIGKALTEQDAVLIASFLMQHPTTITRVSVSGNHIGDHGAAAIGDCLSRCAALSRLDLRHNFIGDDGSVAIANGMMQGGKLTRLDLSGNGVGPRGCAALARMLQTNTTLIRLDIRHNCIGNEGAAYLAGCLSSNASLERLDVGSNLIGSKGCLALSRALEVNRKIRELDVRNNDIGYEAEQALAAAVTVNGFEARRVLWTSSSVVKSTTA